MFGIEVFGWTPIFHAETKTFRLEGSAYAHLDKEMIDLPIGVRFTKSPVDGLGYITNAPSDADLTQIPRITTNLFGGLALQYPSGIGVGDLGGGTKGEQIARAKEIALEDNYGWGPYWIDEITTFGCADPTATNYESDIDFHVGDSYCGYGCDDENRNTDYLGNCLADCKEGYELVQASQAKPAECVAIEELKGGTDECESGYELDDDGNCIESSDEPIEEPIEESPNYLLFGGIAVAGLIAFVVMKK